MGNKIFTMSKDGKSEYCANVVRVGELKPIDGSDFLAQTYIGDASLVVRKDQVHEGQLLFYISNECQINEKFLSVNNLYEIGCYENNANADEVSNLLEQAHKAEEESRKDYSEEDTERLLSERDNLKNEAKSKCGFFSKSGRVRMIRLRKTPSMGFLFGVDEMVKYCPKAKDINLEEYLNVDFDTVDGELFVKAYVPYSQNRERNGKGGSNKAQKKIDRFDKIIPGEFMLHYNTNQLGKYISQISVTDCVSISCKIHGTSGIFSNIKVKYPINLPPHKWLVNKFIDVTGLFKSHRITDYKIVYDSVYSSRTVIKNQYINKKADGGYYNADVWGEYNELLKGKIEKGMTVYGEIFGYITNENKMIQKGYDYGCAIGTNKFMPYRITSETDDRKKYEWNVFEVKEWTEKLIEKYPEIKGRIQVIPILYHGTLQDLYPNLDIHNHWNENVLEAMMNDKEHFGMEELEPLCSNKVPREGIVVRIDDDPITEAFKLKCVSFREREAKLMDMGEVDIEMEESYVNDK